MNKGITEVKISMPLIDDIELQRIDNYYNDIVKEYTKAFLKEKEQVIAQRIMINLQQENQELKAILIELEEWLKEKTKLCDDYLIGECHTDYTDVLDKIQELKEKYK